MRNRIVLILALMVGLPLSIKAQKSTLWLTYSQSTFVYSPGLEFAYFFKGRMGIQVAINSAYVDYDPIKVANAPKKKLDLIHNFNLGANCQLFEEGQKKLGVYLGAKVYYGSDYRKLHYYEDGGYNIYFDFYESQPAIGWDFGLAYSYKKTSFLFKYDTACGRIRLGIGYHFGTL